MMLGAPDNASLTAVHEDGLTQATPSKAPTPEGTVSSLQLAPPFTVPMTTGLPNIPNPTAVQEVALKQAMPLSPSTFAGMGWTLQEFPPSFDVTTESDPAEMQKA
jgi:hypothetical protein